MFEALTLSVLAGLAYDTNGRFVGLISPFSLCLHSVKKKSAGGAEISCARTHSQGSGRLAPCRLSWSRATFLAGIYLVPPEINPPEINVTHNVKHRLLSS
jgi:hypothetical protein